MKKILFCCKWNLKIASIPYNPDVANVFYRAGYSERWGRGIGTICDACRELGAELPVYELRGNGLRVRFAALQSAVIEVSKVPNGQSDQKNVQKGNDLENRVIALTEADAPIRKNARRSRRNTVRSPRVASKYDLSAAAGAAAC